jgi:hypothetical protein
MAIFRRKDKTMQSPAVVKSLEMDFSEAIRAVINGKRITRLDWDNKEVYVLLRGGFLMIYQDGEFSRLLVSDGDLLSADWIVVEDNALAM